MLPQPSLQWALCLWPALRRGPERHQRGAAAAGLRHRQLTQFQHCPRTPGAGHIIGRHPRRALEGDLWPPASADCQVARHVGGLEGGICPSPVWSDHKKEIERVGFNILSGNRWTLSEGGKWWGGCWGFRVLGHLKWCQHSVNHSITYIWSYWGSVERARHDTWDPVALNDSKDCHWKSPAKMQHHLHGNN